MLHRGAEIACKRDLARQFDLHFLVIADIDLGMISLAKAAADPSGHYSRPDVTQLLLNKTRREPVVVQLTPVPEGNAAEPVEA